MKELVRLKVVDINKPTANGNIYSEECFKKVLKRKKPLFVHQDIRPTGVMNFTNVAGVVEKMEIFDNKLIAEVSWLKESWHWWWIFMPWKFFRRKYLKPLAVELMERGNCQLSPVGHGNVDEKGRVYNYSMTGVHIIPKEKEVR
jgi:hypothetical protein